MKEKRMRNLAVFGLLIVAMFAMAAPVQAAQDLKITDYNKGYLRDTYWTPYTNGELLGWASSQYYLDATYKNLLWVGNYQATTVADNYGNYWGSCVSLTKALSKNNLATSSWIRGKHVMDGGVTQGTVIAKFNADGTYDSWGGTGHAAIFDVYLQGQGPAGFRVWDQNFVYPSAVGRHILYPSGSGVNNANNYYVVQVP